MVNQPMSMWRQVAGLIGWLLASFVAAAVGAVASASAQNFYAQLSKPGWAPPAWLFAPVWTLLYALMGVSAWLVWRTGGFREHRAPLTLFVVQLIANALWTWIFFEWNEGGLAFAEIVILWCLILATMVMFWRVRASAGVLLLPYLAWVTFATALTFSTWQRNPGIL